MGWCHEFGAQIEPACGHPMRAASSFCSCASCGVTCAGRFAGCAVVWEQGPGPTPAARPEPRALRRAEPAGDKLPPERPFSEHASSAPGGPATNGFSASEAAVAVRPASPTRELLARPSYAGAASWLQDARAKLGGSYRLRWRELEATRDGSDTVERLASLGALMRSLDGKLAALATGDDPAEPRRSPDDGAGLRQALDELAARIGALEAALGTRPGTDRDAELSARIDGVVDRLERVDEVAARVDAAVDRLERAGRSPSPPPARPVAPTAALVADDSLDGAILELAERWGETDRTERKLAHRASYLGVAWVLPSTVRRTLYRHGVSLPGSPQPERGPEAPFPPGLERAPGRLWCWDVGWSRGTEQFVHAIVDAVSRKWLATGLPDELTMEAVDGLVAAAHDADVAGGTAAPVVRPSVAVLAAVPLQHAAVAATEIAAQLDRSVAPATRPHPSWLRPLLGQVQAEWPHLGSVTDRSRLAVELERARVEYNTVRLHGGLGYVTPSDEHAGRGDAIRAARRHGLARARRAGALAAAPTAHRSSAAEAI